eukprot:scaffold8907_cov105-Isochrysis_galbana.AAC.5
MAMRSPLIRVSNLLSSSTVFIDSIHRVSTGPSISSHFSSGFSSAHTSRITLASTPSVHSKVGVRHGLGVDDDRADRLEAVDAGLLEVGHRGGQHVPRGRLAAERRADQHVAVSRQLGLVGLDALEDDRRDQLQVARTHLVLERLLQLAVVDGRHVCAGEEVRHERVEQRHVLRDELWRVHVADRPQQDDVLWQPRVRPFERARLVEHRLDRAQAKVIVVLLRELLHHQVVQRVHLLGQNLGGGEALGVQHDLDDERDLRPAGVAGVHRDEDAARRIKPDLPALEDKARPLLSDGGPRARLGETGEHAAERLVIEPVGAVEDDAVLGKVLGKVLDRFRLAGAGRALRQPAAVQVERGGESGVAPVSERRDDQAAGVAEVLVSEPVRGAARLDHLVDDLARVHLHGQDVDHLVAVELAEVAAHHVAQLVEQRRLLLARLAHRRLVALGHGVQRLGALDRPGHLASCEREHAGPVLDPLLALGLLHLAVALEQQRSQRGHHVGLDAEQPRLDRPAAQSRRRQRHVLLVGRVDPDRLEHLLAVLAHFLHLERLDRLEALAHVRLHRLRVARLAEDLEQVVVGQEIEAREGLPLRLEVLVERLLDAVELLVHHVEAIENAWRGAASQRGGRLAQRPHCAAEGVVHVVEHAALGRQLLADVLRPHKDRFEVHPLALGAHQHLDGLRDVRQRPLPLLEIGHKGRGEARRLHGGERHRIVLERRVDVLGRSQLEVLLVLSDVKLQIGPERLHLEHGLLDGQLLGRRVGEGRDELLVVLEAELEHPLERERVGVRVEALPDLLHQLRPVPVPHRRVAQVADERHQLLDAVDLIRKRVEHLPALDLLLELVDALAVLLGHSVDGARVHAAELAKLPLVHRLGPLAKHGPDRLELAQVLLDGGRLLVGRRVDGEDGEAGDHLGLALADGLALGPEEAVARLAHPIVEVVERRDQVVLQVGLGFLQPARRVGQHLGVGAPIDPQLGQPRQLRLLDLHLELLEQPVLRLERLEARLGPLDARVLSGVQVDLGGELVEVEWLLLEGLGHFGHVAVERVAVRHQRLLERRRVDPDETDAGDALLRLDVLLQLFVPGDVRLEGG